MTEKLKLPAGGEVINSDWKDDIDYETFGTNKQEMEYVSPAQVDQAAIERIKSIDLKPLFRSRGRKIANLIKSEQMISS